jgi:CRP-like cAMP-binding protein
MRTRFRSHVAEIEHLCSRHRLLSRLSEKDRRRMAGKMRLVFLRPFHRLYEVSGVITDVFFPLSAVLHFLGTTMEGDVVEVGQIGSEGIAGVEVAMRTRFAGMSLMTAAIEVPGVALQMRADDFADEVDRYPSVNRWVRRYIGFFLGQLQFLVACNRHHSVEQRGAWWLLSLQDRTGVRDMAMTQQHFADMLGVTRQTADKLLTDFEGGNIVVNRRGAVTIKDRTKLLDRACDCYLMIAKRLKNLFQPDRRP